MRRSRNSDKARTRVAASPPGSDPRADGHPRRRHGPPARCRRPDPHRPRYPRGRRSLHPRLRDDRTPRWNLHTRRRLGRGRALMCFGRPERGVGGRSWRARMDREGRAKVRRKLIIQTRPREPEACYANHCFFRVLSPVETFCVNGRARATARRRFLSHFPGNDEPRVGAFAHDFAPTS